MGTREMADWNPKIQDLINRHFPPSEHPYRLLERTIEGRLTPSATVLEIGCGRSAPVLQKMKGRAGRLIGIDVVDFTVEDPDIALIANDVAAMRDIGDESVDLAFSRSVMEHVDDATAAYAEIRRVLKPGGCYVFLTPSLYDYASLVAAVVPNRLHPGIVRATEGRDCADTFPTRYRSNTRRAIRRLAAGAGLTIEDFRYLGQYPNYLAFNATLFRLGCAYAKFLERHPSLHALQGWILCTVARPPAGPEAASRAGA